MGRIFAITLTGKIYSCEQCHTDFALADDIMSKSFRSYQSKAYLFDNVVNVFLGEKKEHKMITGMHDICDIFCVCCGSYVGWKYETAHKEDQKYKEGKFILQRISVVGPNEI